jgi:hypothetical protein
MTLQGGRLVGHRLEVDLVHVTFGDLARGPVSPHLAVFHPQDVAAQAAHVPHVVRNEQHGLAFGD